MGQLLQVAGTVDCAWSDILRAAISVGRRNARAVFAHGQYSVFEANYRAYMVKANLTEDQNQRLVRTEAYQELDPTEKGAVSYFLSMGLVKLLCEHFFGVKWLLHLDNFAGDIDPPLGRGSRPDLIGRDANDDWVVVEVKGRSNEIRDTVLDDGKAQCTMITHIEQQVPALRIVAALGFEEHRVQTVIRDPEGDRDPRSELKIGRAKLLREYYTPIADAVRSEGRQDRQVIGNRTFIMARFEALDFELGLDDRIVGALGRDRDEAVVEGIEAATGDRISTIKDPQLGDIQTAENQSVQLFRTRSSIADELPRAVSVGADGIAVRLGPLWSAANLLAPARD
jgi:hypothetical protein